MGFGENRSSASLACRKGGLAIGQSFGQKKLRGLLSLQVRQDITTLCSKIVVAELRPKFAVPWYRLWNILLLNKELVDKQTNFRTIVQLSSELGKRTIGWRLRFLMKDYRDIYIKNYNWELPLNQLLTIKKLTHFIESIFEVKVIWLWKWTTI